MGIQTRVISYLNKRNTAPKEESETMGYQLCDGANFAE